MIIEDVESFKTWVAQALQPICDADPVALAKYVLALVKKDKPEDELRHICNDQLDVFLQDSTKDFVDRLFQFLSDSGYVAGARSSDAEPGTSDMQNAACAESMLQQKEKKEMDEGDLARLKKLHEDIMAHNVLGVQQCLLDGAHVNECIDKQRALCLAVEEKRTETVKLLLEAGAIPNLPRRHGYFELYPIEMCADIKDENQEIARLLLQAGAYIQCHSSPNALHEAVKKDNIPLLQLLLENNADVNLETFQEMETPLHQACADGNLKMAKLLIEHGAECYVDRNVKYNTTSPLCAAMFGGHVEVVKLVLENGADPNEEDFNEYTPLLDLCDEHIFDLEMVKVLVEAGANVSPRRYGGLSCIHLLARYKPKVDVLKYLIGKGADVYAESQGGGTPIRCACNSVNAEFIATLLDLGVDVRIGDTKETGEYIETVLKQMKGRKRVYYHRVWTTVSLLIAAGCFLPPVTTLNGIRDSITGFIDYKRPSEEDISEAVKILTWIESRVGQPYTLSDICRLRIRSICGHSGGRISEKIDNISKMHVPEMLKTFLKFEDLVNVTQREKDSGGICYGCCEYKDECTCDLCERCYTTSPDMSSDEDDA